MIVKICNQNTLIILLSTTNNLIEKETHDASCGVKVVLFCLRPPETHGMWFHTDLYMYQILTRLAMFFGAAALYSHGKKKSQNNLQSI